MAGSRTASISASLGRLTPRAAQAAAAAAAARLSGSGAGCQAGGPWCVSRPMHSTLALMTPSPLPAR